MGCGCDGNNATGNDDSSRLWIDLWVPLAPGAAWYLPAERMPYIGPIVGALMTAQITAVGIAASEAGNKVNWNVMRTAAATADTDAQAAVLAADLTLARTTAWVDQGFGIGEGVNAATTKIPRGFLGLRLRNTSAVDTVVVRFRAWLSIQRG